MNEFIVWCPDLGDQEDGSRISAYSAKEAAEQWADEEDTYSGDYLIIGGRDMTVIVRDVASGAEVKMSVSGEAVAVYSAREVIDQEIQK